MKEKIIYKSYGMFSLKEIEEEEKQAKEILIENGIEEPTEHDILDNIYESNNMWYEDELCNLNKQLSGRILAIASIGRWNGRVSGYKVLGDNLNEILNNISCDEIKVYCDRYNVRATGYHHDGSNSVEYRMIREDRNYDILLDKIYNNEKISRSMINYYTKSIRNEVAEIFGW